MPCAGRVVGGRQREALGETMCAHSFPLDASLIPPLAAFTPGSQAGVRCQVKPGVASLQQHALPRRVESEGPCPPSVRPPPPPPSSAASFQFLFWLLSSGGGRGRRVSTQQHAAFAKLIFRKQKKNHPHTLICSKKSQQM